MMKNEKSFEKIKDGVFEAKEAEVIEEVAQTFQLKVRENVLSDGSKTYDVVALDTEFDVPCLDEMKAYFCRTEIAAAIYRATR